MGTAPLISVNTARLWASLEEMARIGATPGGGCNRRALTDLDGEARRLFCRWCAEAGMEISVDSMGNIFALRPGTEPGLDPVSTGSHLDTQPTGGKYDGVYGVLAGLEIVRTLNDHGIDTRRPIAVVVWTNEEGTRFPPAMLSSGVFAGVYEESWAKAVRDHDGATLGEELARIGFAGTEPVGKRRLHAFYELHIEQGPILEREGVDIGIVTHGQGFCWLDACVKGSESHAGSTPMAHRRDALLGAARMIDLIDRIAREQGDGAVGTAGFAQVHPNSRNTIPGQVRFSVDFRHYSQAVIDTMRERFERESASIAAALGLGFSTTTVGSFHPVAFDEDCLQRLRDAAHGLGLPHRDIISGAGHDACYLARVAPTAMLFCPCKGGISHNEIEDITERWAEQGANVLLRAMAATAQ